MSERIGANLDATRESLAKAGTGFLSDRDIANVISRAEWMHHLGQPWIGGADVATKVDRVLAEMVPSGAGTVVVGSQLVTGGEPWGPADHLRFRPSTVLSLEAWSELIPARRVTVLVGTHDDDSLRTDLADALSRTAAPLTADRVLGDSSGVPVMDDLVHRIEAAGFATETALIDGDDRPGLEFTRRVFATVGAPEKPDGGLPRRRTRRATNRAIAALGAAVGDGDLLTPAETEVLGTFMGRTLRSSFDSPPPPGPRRAAERLDPNGQIGRRPQSVVATGPEQPSEHGSGRQLLVHISNDPISRRADEFLTANRAVFVTDSARWVRPAVDLVGNAGALGWLDRGSEGGRYREFHAAIDGMTSDHDAEARLSAGATWLVTLHLEDDVSIMPPGGQVRALGARIVDLMDVIEPESTNVLVQVAHPGSESVTADGVATSFPDRSVDRMLRSIPGTSLSMEVLDERGSAAAESMQHFAEWLSAEIPGFDTLKRYPDLAASPRAVAVAVILGREHGSADIDSRHLDEFIAEIGKMIIETDDEGVDPLKSAST